MQQAQRLEAHQYFSKADPQMQLQKLADLRQRRHKQRRARHVVVDRADRNRRNHKARTQSGAVGEQHGARLPVELNDLVGQTRVRIPMQAER